MKKFIFIRTLKKVDFSVFCVDDDQKRYYDKQFNVYQPYSSGQQVKRSIMELFLQSLNLQHAPITYNYEIDDKKGKIQQKEITQPCDPTYPDQLIGGYMSAGKRNKDDDAEKIVYKRRSPFSVSAMTPIHPLLSSLVHESQMTFDRSESNDEIIVVRNNKGDEVDIEEVKKFLTKNNKSISKRKIVAGEKGKNRVNGLFKMDMAIDLSRLFTVPILKHDMEISSETIEKLRNEGWEEIEIPGGTAFRLPEEKHEEYAEAIAWSIVNWQITSNQSRTFDTMPTLSIAISTRADEISGSIYGELIEEGERPKAELVIDNNYENTKIFSTKLLSGYVKDVETSYSAIDNAVKEIKNQILEYYS